MDAERLVLSLTIRVATMIVAMQSGLGFALATDTHPGAGLPLSRAQDTRQSATTEDTEVQRAATRGADYARKGRFDDAVAEYRKALAVDGGNASVRLGLGITYFKALRIAEAARELAVVVRAEPGNLTAALLLSDCYLRMNKYKEVINLLVPLEADQAENRVLHYILGTAYVRFGQLEKAQVIAQRLLRDGDSPEARILLGTADLVVQDYPQALREFNRALELNPNLASANSFRGRALWANGEHEAAKAAFQREIRLNPSDFASYYYLGMLLKEERQFQEALQNLQSAHRLQPTNPNVRHQIATLLLAMDRIAEAEQQLEGLVRDDPNYVQAHVTLATIYYRTKRKAEGDRQRTIVQKLNAEIQERSAAAKTGVGTAYRGEALPVLHTD